MAEVKNAFIKSKMNQDLDARLLPNGEYREGFNIQVSKSESSDAGALENVLGNKLLKNADLEAAIGRNDISVIGAYVERNIDTVFLFVTNYTDQEFSKDNKTIKYNPEAKHFIYSYNVKTSILTRLVQGAFLNFSTTHPIIGVNVLEDLLFWTDNRNQPRKINIKSAAKEGDNNAVYYTFEDQISVAKYNPYKTIQLYKYQTDPTPYGGSSKIVTTMQDVVSENLPDGTTSNPYFDPEYVGDPDFLEDKFVRFSYRFKFKDGEYSVFAPFTQEAFIPKQDGYFLGTESDANTSSDEIDAYKTTEVAFMVNKANRIGLVIPFENKSFLNDQKISEIDVLYKESDGLAVQVVDTISVNDIVDDNGNLQNQYAGSYYYEYVYQGRKPYKTLPEAQLTRVYDKVPVKAFSQEVSGNRIIYGNFQNKHTPPLSLNYNVTVGRKYDFDVSTPSEKLNSTQERSSIIEYPQHTVKQNRNYQVGVVLADKFGRSSSVILSEVDSLPITELDFYGSTVFHNYATKNEYSGDYNPNTWPGDSIKMLFNDTVNKQPDYYTNSPGVYNGDATSPDYNPLGWYSYKIVVKQTEQEYYNVYTPGILQGQPEKSANNNIDDYTVTLSLTTDNINKVPKDLTDVGPIQVQYTSDVVLYPRVTPNYIVDTNPTFNEAWFPTTKGIKVTSLGNYRDIFSDSNGTPSAPSINLYGSSTNPSAAIVSTSKSGVAKSTDDGILGGTTLSTATEYNFYLGVLETEPVKSRLDIYWETSTSGSVVDLNTAITEGKNAPIGINGFDWSLNENDPIGTTVTGLFYPVKPGFATFSEPIPDSTLNNWGVIDASLADRKSDFEVIKVLKGNTIPGSTATLAYDAYYIKTKNTFVFTANSTQTSGAFNFSFNFSSSGETESETFKRTVFLENENPIILASDGQRSTPLPTSINILPSQTSVYQFTGENGSVSNVEGARQLDLFWSIISGNDAGNFDITENGLLQAIGDNVSGSFNLTIRLQDGGGALDDHTLTVLSDTGGGNNTGDIGDFETTNPTFWCSSTTPVALSIGSGSSGAFYWTSNAENAQVDEPLDRLGVPSLTLPNELSGYDTKTLPAQGSCSNFNWINTNYTSKGTYPSVIPEIANTPNPNPQTETNLKSGTAFIQVQAEAYHPSVVNGFGLIPNCEAWNGEAKIAYPIVLQYRDPNGSGYPNNWKTAIDIEGNECVFGGTQNVSSTPRLAYDNEFGFSQTGVLVDRDLSAFGSSKGLNSSNTAQVNIQMWNSDLDLWQRPYSVDSAQGDYLSLPLYNSNLERPKSILTKTFAIGKDQSYGSEPNRFGDYRLIVRYPYGEIPTPVNSACSPNNNLATLTKTNCPNNPIFTTKDAISGALINSNMSYAWMSYGDFYNPFGVGQPCSSATDNPAFYIYKISSVPSDTEAGAAGLEPTQIVYAREWHLKYVTNFYVDSALQNKANLNGWYSYSTSEDSTSDVVYQKNFFAIGKISRNDKSHSRNYGTVINGNPMDSEEDRRWTANFKNGKKVKATAKPNYFGTLDTTTGACYNYIISNISNSTDLRDSYEWIEVKWVDCNTQEEQVATLKPGESITKCSSTEPSMTGNSLLYGHDPNNFGLVKGLECGGEASCVIVEIEYKGQAEDAGRYGNITFTNCRGDEETFIPRSSGEICAQSGTSVSFDNTIYNVSWTSTPCTS